MEGGCRSRRASSKARATGVGKGTGVAGASGIARATDVVCLLAATVRRRDESDYRARVRRRLGFSHLLGFGSSATTYIENTPLIRLFPSLQ